MPCRGVFKVATVVCVTAGATAGSLAAQRVAIDQPKDVITADVMDRPVTADLQRVAVEVAVKALAVRARVRITFRAQLLDAVRTPVTLHVKNLALGTALDRVLQGTGLHAELLTADVISITPAEAQAPVREGGVSGKIIDAKTRLPLRGAVVSVDDATKGATTSEDGTFRLGNIPAGSHVIRVRLLGYGKATQAVVVADGAMTSMEVALEPSVNALTQVVVTGTVIPTELKAVPNAITVITAKQIEDRGITRIDQLFRGDVPGLFAQNSGSGNPTPRGAGGLGEVVMYSRGATALDNTSAGTFLGTNPIKTYIDGVEMADATFLSQIDPQSIERIEILSGPQASTIYGSNALNGVMQIFTKRGTTSHPQFTVSLLSGTLQNNFNSALTPQHDDAAQMSGVDGHWSYQGGGGWTHTGRWTPDVDRSRMSGYGGARTQVGAVAGDASIRLTNTRNLSMGAGNQWTTEYRASGRYIPLPASLANGHVGSTVSRLQAQTLGLTLSASPMPWWSHELVLGSDAENSANYREQPTHNSPRDTALNFYSSEAARRSIRYSTTAHVPVTSRAQVVITLGGDGWNNLVMSTSGSPMALTGTLNSPFVARIASHNRGGFLQSQVGLWDAVFLTYGLRAEWNPTFGKAAEPNYAPRYGVALTQAVGNITAKLRASYGRSTRPPAVGMAASQLVCVPTSAGYGSCVAFYAPIYGASWDYQLPNPDLAPEFQQGGEGGLELYLGNHGSLVLTHYNQTVRGLIATVVGVDSVRSLVPNPDFSEGQIDSLGYGFAYQQQNINVGTIRNQGWELTGSANVGPLTTQATYSWTKSRVIGVNPKYQAFFSNAIQYPQYQKGASFQFVAEHTWATTITYAASTSSLSLTLNGIGELRSGDANSFLLAHTVSGGLRLTTTSYRETTTNSQVGFLLPSYVTADVNATHRVTRNLDGILQVSNLGDHYQNDYGSSFASLGRQTKLGVRIRW